MDKIIYKEESFAIVGACMEVHRELGRGFLEPVYQESLERELPLRGIPFDREAPLKIFYKGEALKKRYYADFFCYGKIVLEAKAVKKLLPEHEAQLFNYLRATGFKLGILANFGPASLETKRVVLTDR